MTLAAAAGLVACKKKEEAPPPPPPTVEVAAVVQRDVPVFSEWIGTLEGYVNADIRPQIEGYLLKQVYREGSVVSAGDALFEIDPRDFQASYDQANGAVAQYEATLANAKTTTARYKPLAAQKAISQQELDDAETRERTAQANLDSARAAVERAKLNLNWTKVASPIDGIAGVSKAQVGDLVNRQTVMTTVSQVDPIKVYFAPERAGVPGVGEQERPRREVPSEPQGPRRGQAAADPVRRLDVRSQGQAVPGGPGGGREDRHDPDRGRVPQSRQRAAPRTVRQGPRGDGREEGRDPRAAAGRLRAAGSYQVAVVGADNKVTIKVVKPGPVEGNQWVIEEGLKPGDRIIVEGLQRVKSGMTVVPKEAGSAAAEAAEGAPKEAGK